MALEPYIAKLSSFTTAGEIRSFLQDEGVKGKCKAVSECALAEYIHRESGYSVHVGKYQIDSVLPINDRMPFGRLCKTTNAMHDFIRMFDYGFYPELMKK